MKIRQSLIATVLVLAGISQASSAAELNSSPELVSTFSIQAAPNENLYITQAGGYQTAVLTSKRGKLLIVARHFQPQSINSARLRAKEEGVDPLSVQIIRQGKRGTLFTYQTLEFRKFYSTRGGELLLSKRLPFSSSKVKLTPRVERRGAAI